MTVSKRYSNKRKTLDILNIIYIYIQLFLVIYIIHIHRVQEVSFILRSLRKLRGHHQEPNQSFRALDFKASRSH